jgi:hypothetical protein
VLRLTLGLRLSLGLGSANVEALNLTLLLSYPHGNKMKGYGSCALFITIFDFRGPPK